MDVTFQTLFPQFTPPATLADAPVQHVDLYPAQRRVRIELTPGSYLPTRELDDAADTIATLYDLHQVEFSCRYAPELLAQMDFFDPGRIFIQHNPLAARALAGAAWHLEGETLMHVGLVANGVAYLEPGIPAVREFSYRSAPVWPPGRDPDRRPPGAGGPGPVPTAMPPALRQG